MLSNVQKSIRTKCNAGFATVALLFLMFILLTANPSDSACTPPTIISQTPDTLVMGEDTAVFTVIASGTGLSYQWYDSIQGAPFTPILNYINGFPTSSRATTLRFPTDTIDTNAFFECVVTGTCGTTTSAPSRLKLNYPPVITQQPYNISNASPGSVDSLKVVAIGIGPLTYQWRKSLDGVNFNSIAGANSAVYLDIVSTTDTTTYQFNCLVTNSYGTGYSSNTAKVSVALRPPNYLQLSDTFVPWAKLIFRLDSTQKINLQLSDSVFVWFGLGADSVPNFTTPVPGHVRKYTVAAVVQNSFGNRFLDSLIDTNQFNVQKENIHAAMEIVGYNGLTSPVVLAPLSTVGQTLPLNPIVLQDSALNASMVRLNWTTLPPATAISKLRIYYQDSTPLPIGYRFSGVNSLMPALTATADTLYGINRDSITYYFGIQVYDSIRGLWSEIDTASVFVPSGNGSPILSSPANGVSSVSIPTTLNWYVDFNATSYRVQLSNSSSFSMANDTTVSTTSRSFPSLTINTTYYWQVYAINSVGNSAWSSIWSFTTFNIPTIPTLSSPANGASLVTIPTLSWNVDSNATSYRVQLSNSTSFSIANDTTVSTTSRSVSSLTVNTTYYWRVYAINSAGNSSWSSIWSFTTANTLPSIPILFSPVNSASLVPLTTNLNWGVASYATSYRVQLSNSTSFSMANDTTVSTTSRALSSLAINTTYYWQVYAINSVGNSTWSSIWSLQQQILRRPFQHFLLLQMERL